jgi:hypothetical protein
MPLGYARGLVEFALLCKGIVPASLLQLKPGVSAPS